MQSRSNASLDYRRGAHGRPRPLINAPASPPLNESLVRRPAEKSSTEYER